MPPKFRKHIWVKRGDFVITEPIPEGQKVKAEIVRILTKDQIKYYTQQNVWPRSFMQKDTHTHDTSDTPHLSQDDDDDELVCNLNKPQIAYESESSSSSEEEINSSTDTNSKLNNFKCAYSDPPLLNQKESKSDI